jgi:hypothetical protein
MSARDQLTAQLRPLVERMHRGHCWIKTKNGPRRIDRAFTEVELSEHVMKGNAYGLCPIAPGESTCRAAALDLDSHKGATPWAEMLDTAEQIAVTLELDGYHPVLFRSSGGKGVHIYLVWDEPQDAYSVRCLLRAALRVCGFEEGTAGVSCKQIEIFPKQSEVPIDGYGSMVILPFAGESELLTTIGWTSSPPVMLVPRPPKPERVSTDAPELARLKSALDAIPNDGANSLDYDQWRNVVFALHYATEGSDEGYALAVDFSARSPKFEESFLADRVWPYITNNRGGAVVTADTLFRMARQHEWQDPSIIDDFDVVEEQQAASLDTKRFTFLPADQFTAGKPVTWIVKDVLPRAELIVIYGESGSGKSFFALDLAGAIAQGVDWRGKRTAQLKVGYVAAEGAGGFRNRLKAYGTHHGVALSDLNIAVLADAPNFMEKADIVDLGRAMGAAGPLGLVIVDTLAQVTPGANENSGEDMGRVIGHCRTIHKVTGATVVLIHHSGKDASRGARGWSGLRAAADAEIEITRADDDRVATVTKLKDGGDGGEFGFKLLTLPVDMDEDGVISSCVVEHGDAKPKVKLGRNGKPDPRPHLDQAIAALKERGEDHPDQNTIITEAMISYPKTSIKDTRYSDLSKALLQQEANGSVAFERGRLV